MVILFRFKETTTVCTGRGKALGGNSEIFLNIGKIGRHFPMSTVWRKLTHGRKSPLSLSPTEEAQSRLRVSRGFNRAAGVWLSNKRVDLLLTSSRFASRSTNIFGQEIVNQLQCLLRFKPREYPSLSIKELTTLTLQNSTMPSPTANTGELARVCSRVASQLGRR